MVVSPVFFERWGYNGTPRLSDEVGGVHFVSTEHKSFAGSTPLNSSIKGGAWYGNFTVGNATDVVLMLGTGSDDLVLKPGVYKPSPASEPHGPQCELKYGDLLPNSTGNSADVSYHPDPLPPYTPVRLLASLLICVGCDSSTRAYMRTLWDSVM